MKTNMFLDLDEQKQIEDMIESIKKNNLEWITSGSLMVMYDKDLDLFEIYLLRGYITK